MFTPAHSSHQSSQATGHSQSIAQLRETTSTLKRQSEAQNHGITQLLGSIQHFDQQLNSYSFLTRSIVYLKQSTGLALAMATYATSFLGLDRSVREYQHLSAAKLEKVTQLTDLTERHEQVQTAYDSALGELDELRQQASHTSPRATFSPSSDESASPKAFIAERASHAGVATKPSSHATRFSKPASYANVVKGQASGGVVAKKPGTYADIVKGEASAADVVKKPASYADVIKRHL